MLEVNTKTINIPIAERELGVVYDNQTDVRQFKIPKTYGSIDLSQYRCYLMTRNASKKFNIAELQITVEGEFIVATWNVTSTDTSEPGFLYAQLLFKTDAESGPIWQTREAKLYVSDGMLNEQYQKQHIPTLLEQVLQLKIETEGIVAGAENRIDIAISDTVEATRLASQATASSNTATAGANSARDGAIEATGKANTATQEAIKITQDATAVVNDMIKVKQDAVAATAEANAAKDSANNAATNANSKGDIANAAATAANSAKDDTLLVKQQTELVKTATDKARQDSIAQTGLCEIATDNANGALATYEEKLDESAILLTHEMRSNYTEAVHKDVEGSYITVLDSQNGDARETVIEGKSEQRLGKNYCYTLDKSNPDYCFAGTGGGTSPTQYDIANDGFFTTSHRQLDFKTFKNKSFVVGSVYTISFLAKRRVEGTLTAFNQLKIDNNPIGVVGVNELTDSYVLYKKTFTYTENSDCSVSMIFYNNCYFKDIMLNEGSTALPYEPWTPTEISPDTPVPIVGVAESGKIDILCSNKNLFDAYWWANEVVKYNPSTASLVEKDGLSCLRLTSRIDNAQSFIPITLPTNVSLKVKFEGIYGNVTSPNSAVITIYDVENKTTNILPTDMLSGKVFDILNAKKIRPSNFGNNDIYIILDRCVISLNELVSGESNKHQGSTQSVNLEPLYSLPNGVKDEFYLEKNEVLRNIVKIVVTGNENWQHNIPNSSLGFSFFQSGNWDDIVMYNGIFTNNMRCNKFKNQNIGGSSVLIEGIQKTYPVSKVRIKIDNNRCGILEADDSATKAIKFKNWLKQEYDNGEPINFITDSIAPIIQKVPPTYIPVYANCTNVYTTDPLQPNIRFKYPLSLLSLVNKINVLESTISQLQTATTRLMTFHPE